MAPVLFLFLMQAMVESYRRTHQDAPKYHCHPPHTTRGRLLNQPKPAQTKGLVFEFDLSLFVDDGAFLCTSREELERITSDLLSHLRWFGLLMHVGTLNPDGSRCTNLKTEAMYFPASQTDQDASAAIADIVFANGHHYVPFTTLFKYLGAHISSDLTDTREVALRLRQAANQVCALKNFWRCPADLATKHLLFLAIPVNTALYGCESWALTEQLCHSITGFFHTGLRCILGINMHQVKDLGIWNEHLCNKMRVPDPLAIVRQRQFNQLGKFARLPADRLPRKFLGAWVSHVRARGCQYNTLRNSQTDALTSILGDSLHRAGRFDEWLPLAQCQRAWEALSKTWVQRQQQLTFHQYGEHFLFE